ncbi:MAG: RluA family pseudouridine synthase [Dehalococcoidia bacterium]|nr:RluA family pseudouridine synthase [Dehalococcoidia bacterium]
MGHAEGTVGEPVRREHVAGRPGRIDTLLAEAFTDLSRARIQRLIERGHARLNGEVVRKSVLARPGDRLDLYTPVTEHAVAVVDFDLPVLFEDALLIAVDKPAGLAVHGAPGDTGPAVAGWMLTRLGALAAQFEVERPGIVHRLDKDTSGVLLLAKTPASQASLSAAFEHRTAHKTYLAVTDGVPSPARAVIDADIARHPGDRTKMAIAKRGRTSRTEYEVLGSDGEHALVVVRPETGRTHQIRVHLAAIGCPVMFDRLYGRPGEGRQLLHAWRLELPHPSGGTLTVTAPLPHDFTAVVRSLGLEQLALDYTVPEPARLDV